MDFLAKYLLHPGLLAYLLPPRPASPAHLSNTSALAVLYDVLTLRSASQLSMNSELVQSSFHPGPFILRLQLRFHRPSPFLKPTYWNPLLFLASLVLSS